MKAVVARIGCEHGDEAVAPTAVPRRPYVELLDALARLDLVVPRERVRSKAAALG